MNTSRRRFAVVKRSLSSQSLHVTCIDCRCRGEKHCRPSQAQRMHSSAGFARANSTSSRSCAVLGQALRREVSMVFRIQGHREASLGRVFSHEWQLGSAHEWSAQLEA